jgi:hypothetical protein
VSRLLAPASPSKKKLWAGAPPAQVSGRKRSDRQERVMTTKIHRKQKNPDDWNRFFGFGINILVNKLALGGR